VVPSTLLKVFLFYKFKS